jgi:ATP-dependent DNA helicase RecQ
LLYHPADFDIPFHFIENELPDRGQVDYILSESEALNNHTYQDRINLAGVTETGQRFMEYHLEKAKILHKKGIDSLALTEFKESLLQKILDRKREKLKHLKIMEKWIVSQNCKRKELLHYFGEEEGHKVQNCCSSCEADITPFFGIKVTPIISRGKWEEELKRIFRQEEEQKI